MPSFKRLGGPPRLAKEALSKEEKTAAAAIPGAAIELVLREVWILDNFDNILEQLFGGSNEIKLVSMVFDGASKDPFRFEVGSFPGIKKEKQLPLGDAGLALYFSESDALPRFLDWRLLIVEDDSDVRNAGKVIQQIQKTEEYKRIVDVALALADPTWDVVARIANTVISLVASVMEQNEDDIISLYAATYTLIFDHLGVGAHTFYHEGRTRVKYEIKATL